MIDPPRREVRDAINTCRRAGIKTVMITGDHGTTAEAIAHQLGIMPRGGLAMSGQDLNRMDDAELDAKVDNIYVYSRVSPEHKLRIVKSLQRKGHGVGHDGRRRQRRPGDQSRRHRHRHGHYGNGRDEGSFGARAERRQLLHHRGGHRGRGGAFTKIYANLSATCWHRTSAKF
ncbi:HAD family hydrolase [Paenibacillus sp. JTLBN-2024]